MNETKENRQLKFVLKIDKKDLNVVYFRNESNSSPIKAPTSAELKGCRQFQSKSFAQIKVNKSNGILACACEDDIQILNLDSNKCVADIKEHYEVVYCLENIDENRFASGNEDGTIKIWSTSTFDCLKTLVGHQSNVFSLKSLPLNRIASGSEEEIKIWDLESGDCLQTLNGHLNLVNGLVCLLNGNLVSGSEDETLKVWDLNSGECLQTLTGHSDTVTCLVLLNNGHVASCSCDETIKIWNIEKGQCIKTLRGHSRWVSSLEVLVNGELLSCSYDQTFKVWDLNKEGRCIKTLVGNEYDSFVIIRINRQKTALVSCSYDEGSIKIWDLIRLNCVETIQVERNVFDFIWIPSPVN